MFSIFCPIRLFKFTLLYKVYWHSLIVNCWVLHPSIDPDLFRISPPYWEAFGPQKLKETNMDPCTSVCSFGTWLWLWIYLWLVALVSSYGSSCGSSSLVPSLQKSAHRLSAPQYLDPNSRLNTHSHLPLCSGDSPSWESWSQVECWSMSSMTPENHAITPEGKCGFIPMLGPIAYCHGNDPCGHVTLMTDLHTPTC